MSPLRSVLDPKTRVSVSSTSQGSSKKHLLDPESNDEEIPWSVQAPAWAHLTFPRPIKATHLALIFQGGFVGTSASIWVARSKDAEGGGIGLGLMMGGKIYPEDRNKRQVFEIPFPPTGLSTELHEPEPTDPEKPSITTEITAAEANSAAIAAHPDGHGITKPSTAGTGASDGGKDDEYPYLTELKIEFEKSSDQYGRVTLYSIEVLSDLD